MNKTIMRLSSVLAGLIVFVGSAYAQITTSAMNGKIIDQSGEPVPGATVIAVHTPSGTQYHAVANAEGRYFIEGMRTGGPYEVNVDCLGYKTKSFDDIRLQLAESFSLSIVLEEDTQILEGAVVVSDKETKLYIEKTGSATNINSNQILDLPTISRNITEITKLSPYGGNGMSFAGTDGRTANFTVDGANFNNNFGLSENLPGGGSPISIDAIDELQVVISPYDVRQTNFIGGGVNAVTKSGTNKFKGSAYVYHRNENMRGDMAAGTAVSGARDLDRNTTYGFTLGGPIVKNKLFFFANFEYTKIPKESLTSWRPSVDGKADPNAYISRTTISDMDKVSKFLKEKYGYDTGSSTDFPADESNMKILGRLDWNITNDHHLAVRYNYTLNRGWNLTNGSSSDCGQRTTQSRFSQYSMAFANSLYSMDNKVNTWSVDLNSRLSNELSNEFLATYSMLDDVRGSNSAPFPFIDILDGTGTITPYMSAGYELFTWNNGVHNRVLTVKDDLTWFLGNHKIFGGVSYEYQMADNAYMREGTGYYRYNSLDDFLTGATPETVTLTYGYTNSEDPLNPAARVRYHKASIYAQDEWSPAQNFKLTAGLRLESLIFDNKDLMTNQAMYDVDYNGTHIDTGIWPKTQVQILPRIGFVWDVLNNNSLKVRGGTGLFAGRIPLVFFTNMPTNSNMVQRAKASITTTYKNGVATPDPLLANFAGDMITDPIALRNKMNALDPKQFPLEITPKDGAMGDISAVDPNFRMPQVWKTSLAIDYNFPTSFPMSLSVEGIYNKTVFGVCMRDINIMPADGFARLNNGDDHRHIYPANYKYNKNSAYVLTNTNQGYGWDFSATFKISPIKNLDIIASYSHVVNKELTGMPGSDAASAFTYVPTTEGPNNAVLHNSQYVTPDRVFASLTYHDPANNHWSLFYETWRGGGNYSYMYTNDLNGDNYNYDALYIPKTADELRFASNDDRDRFWAYVNNDEYLSKHKGEYAEAYSVYSPWVHRLDFRFAHDFKLTPKAKNSNIIQINFDVKNLLNLFNNSWGVAKYMNPALDSGRILKSERIDPDGAPVFSTPAAVSGNTQTWTYSTAIGQCWYAQIGIKYLFN